MVAEVSQAGQEQAAGIDQINGAVTRLDQVTQQNAALVQSSATSSTQILQRSRRLSEAVAVFS